MHSDVRAQVLALAYGRLGLDDVRKTLPALLRAMVAALLFDELASPALSCVASSLPRFVAWGIRKIPWGRVYRSASMLLPRGLAEATSTRRAEVSYITEDQRINPLFEAVEWFVSDSMRGKPPQDKPLVHFSTEEVKGSEKAATPVACGLPEDGATTLDFEGCRIEAALSSREIRLHADRVYTRKNRTIALSVRMRESDERDVLRMFVEMCQKKHAAHVAARSREPEVHRSTPDGRWEKTGSEIYRRPETVVLRGGVRESVFGDLDAFMVSEDWYRSRDVPYARRFLFFGRPGTGKTSLVKAIATKYGRSLHFLMLSQVKSDDDLVRLFERVEFKSTVVVIEDIDCASSIVRARQPEPAGGDGAEKEGPDEEEKKLTLSGLLNVIDGAMLNTHGQILIMTTNHADRLDEALVRAGRCDRKIEFDFCDAAQARNMFRNFFGPEAAQDPPMATETWPATGPKSPADVSAVLIQHRSDAAEAWRALTAL